MARFKLEDKILSITNSVSRYISNAQCLEEKYHKNLETFTCLKNSDYMNNECRYSSIINECESYISATNSLLPNNLIILIRIENDYLKLINLKKSILSIHEKLVYAINLLDVFIKSFLIYHIKKISKSFGIIFSQLLPLSTAHLVQTKGNEISEGIKIEVVLSGLRTGNLKGLSGGQRSLLAISLLLALLGNRTSPFYILDEIDSALDQEHTINIGTTLRTHFKLSQFFVVSLKDGMYSNATVISHTSLSSGKTTLTLSTSTF